VTLKTFSDPIPNLDSFLFWDQAKIKKGSRGGKPKKYYKNFFRNSLL
jgi:hypothetical protein